METKCSARLGALCDTRCENSLSLSLSLSALELYLQTTSIARSLVGCVKFLPQNLLHPLLADATNKHSFNFC
jgi:hypothetical protein